MLVYTVAIPGAIVSIASICHLDSCVFSCCPAKIIAVIPWQASDLFGDIDVVVEFFIATFSTLPPFRGGVIAAEWEYGHAYYIFHRRRRVGRSIISVDNVRAGQALVDCRLPCHIVTGGRARAVGGGLVDREGSLA